MQLVSEAYRNQLTQLQSVANAFRAVDLMVNQSLRLSNQFAVIHSLQEALKPRYNIAQGIAAAMSAVNLRVDQLVRPPVVDWAKFAAININPAATNISAVLTAAFAARSIPQVGQLSRVFERLAREEAFRCEFTNHVQQAETELPKAQSQNPHESEVLAVIEDGIVKSGIASESLDAKIAIRAFFKWLDGVNPDVKAAAINLICGLIVLFFGMLLSRDNGKSVLNVTSVTVKHEIKELRTVITNLNFPGGTPQNLRIVTERELNVYSKNRLDSERVAKITFPQIVMVKGKNRNWTEIIWLDQMTGETKEGWTLTRYLKPL